MRVGLTLTAAAGHPIKGMPEGALEGSDGRTDREEGRDGGGACERRLGAPARHRDGDSDPDPLHVSAPAALVRLRGDRTRRERPLGGAHPRAAVRVRRPPRAGTRRDGPPLRRADAGDRPLPDRRDRQAREHPRRRGGAPHRARGSGGEPGHRASPRRRDEHSRHETGRRLRDPPFPGPHPPQAPGGEPRPPRVQSDPGLSHGRRARAPRVALAGLWRGEGHPGGRRGRPGDRGPLRRLRPVHRPVGPPVHRALRLPRGGPGSRLQPPTTP